MSPFPGLDERLKFNLCFTRVIVVDLRCGDDIAEGDILNSPSNANEERDLRLPKTQGPLGFHRCRTVACASFIVAIFQIESGVSKRPTK